MQSTLACMDSSSLSLSLSLSLSTLARHALIALAVLVFSCSPARVTHATRVLQGFNRYNGEFLPDFIDQPKPGKVNVSRTLEEVCETLLYENILCIYKKLFIFY